MALLTSCWLLVESFIFPDGLFLKWFYLSFYIHPLFLLFCQIILWLNKLKTFFLLLISFPFKILCFLNSSIFKFLNKIAIIFFPFNHPNITHEVFYDVIDQEIPHISTQEYDEIVVFHVNETRFQSGVFLSENCSSFENTSENATEDSWLNEYLYSDHYDRVLLTHYDDTSVVDLKLQDSEVESTSTCRKSHEEISCSIASSSQLELPASSIHGESADNSLEDPGTSFCDSVDNLPECSPAFFSSNSDSFHQKYTERTRFFEILYPERLCGLDSEVESTSTCRKSHEEISCSTASLSQLELPASSIHEESADNSVEDPGITSSDSVDNLPERLPAFSSSNSDSFHQKYTERMRFFKILYHERLCGLDAILNEHITSPLSYNSIESSADFSMQYISWNEMARKRLMKSLECDFELIYVAQLCLSWEALHHQYQKVEALTLSNSSEKSMFQHSISGKFQEFQVLLERFVEEGQRYSRHKRLPVQGLLPVPDVSGFMVEQGCGEEAIRATQVLEAIEKCIKALWLYLKTDNKKSMWKYKGILPTHPPVEDLGDLELLYNVTKTLHKKEMLLKDMQGKKKGWLIRTKMKTVQEQDDKTILLFAMIELKLVQRLLKMSVISSSHLKWCQEKLNNLEFRQGKVFRSPMDDLFPSSLSFVPKKCIGSPDAF